MRKFYYLGAALAILAAVPTLVSAQIVANRTGDVRVTADLDLLPGGGNAGDENGGFTQLILGLNTGNVQNWALLGFDLSTVSTPADISVGGELTIGVNPNFTNGNHGDTGNSFSVYELYGLNNGWLEGTQGIANNAVNVAQNGVVTFQQQAFNATDWVGNLGNPVTSFLDAFDNTAPLDTVGAYNQGAAPASLTFTFNAATGQQWLNQGFVDLVIGVNDPDGLNTSRFSVLQDTAQLTINPVATIPEPSSAALLGLAMSGLVMRRKRR